MKSSMRRCSLASTHWFGSKLPSDPSPRGTSQATRQPRSSTLNLVLAPAPDCPASRRDHVASTPQASGVTKPNPVMTTRRIPAYTRESVGKCRNLTRFSTLSFLDEFDGIANSDNGFRRVVGNFNAEFLFESHDQLDGVEAVRAKIFNEARPLGDLFAIYIEVFDHDLLHALSDVAHIFSASAITIVVFHFPRSATHRRPSWCQSKLQLKSRAWYHKLPASAKYSES